MLKRKFDLTENEERIVSNLEKRLENNNIRISRRDSRYILEISREELLERARERQDWNLIGQLYNPEPDTKAEALLISHMRTVYEETEGNIPNKKDDMYL